LAFCGRATKIEIGANLMKIQAEIPDQLYKLLQTLVSDGWYLSEQDVIEEALRRFLHTHKSELMEKFIWDDVEWGLHGKI
jgi:Arc/MetJ-type ribon-helix-helix transcriptional regulator